MTGIAANQQSAQRSGPRHGGLVRQPVGSAPIRSPSAARLFIVSLTNVPGFGGVQSSGIAIIRTSMSASCLRRAVSAIWYNKRIEDRVAERVESSIERLMMSNHRAFTTVGGACNWLLKITQ